MGTFAETATSIIIYRLPTWENKLPFSELSEVGIANFFV
jgi:hypothetical protein